MDQTGTNLIVSLGDLIFRDLLIVIILAGILVPLNYTRRAAIAVVRQNFRGYFSNPTGYVFLCVFVLLTSFAAFWPKQFFNANLANLSQLNEYLPLIMLIYIPAITMGIWSEERRGKTDELLLTLPARDSDIVIGKFISAALIFTVSLLFSQLSNFLVLASLAKEPNAWTVDLDTGLLATNYFGYWLIGLAMLAIGMVASFLTSNMTIAFVFGLAFNVPLVAAKSADLFSSTSGFAQMISKWGIHAQFDDFQRGVLSLSSTMYFVMIICISLYLCMIMIGKRHWSGGRDGDRLWIHFIIRICALIVMLFSLTVVFDGHDLVRQDTTQGKISSLSDHTRKLIDSLKPEHPVYVEAFISNQVPEKYIKTRYDLISLLKEFDSHDKIFLTLHDNLESYDSVVANADDNHGISLINVTGENASQPIIMGAVFRSGLEKVVVPFFDYGIPVEYELARSIATVAKGTRKTIGVIDSDANIMGGYSFASGRPTRVPQQGFITELQKQYRVVNVDSEQEISTTEYDLLFIAQPSSLEDVKLTNILRALQAGVPAVIFEDPRPETIAAPGTGMPRQSIEQMMGLPGTPQQKGSISRLWDLLGIHIPGKPSETNPGLWDSNLVWQTDNPYPLLKYQDILDTWIFTRNLEIDHDITRDLQEVLIPVGSPIEVDPTKDHMTITPLIRSSIRNSGTLESAPYQIELQALANGSRAAKSRIKQLQNEGTNGIQNLAVHIKGAPAGAQPDDDGKTPEVEVVYISDLDIMFNAFLTVRARPTAFQDVSYKFENITFLLNVVDYLTKEVDYIAIRNRKLRHSSLKTVEHQINLEQENLTNETARFHKVMDSAIASIEEDLNQEIEDLQTQLQTLQDPTNTNKPDPAILRAKVINLNSRQQENQRKLEVERVRQERDRDKKIATIRRDSNRKIAKMQNQYKFLAVLIPPIPPLLIAVFVFFRRRIKEREGVAAARLR
ncbi:MAG: ABC transporter permease [Rhodopirellula sp.]|nr:ABC transporter permease [Rhodopirellula sp.]|tara:strand:+ start:5897 stop:8773 length:2877 start_codon:yes stop_codon:yes gene_type:complete